MSSVSAQVRHVDLLREARAAHGRRDWPRAYELFTAAERDSPLEVDDLDALSDAAWWLGRVDDCLRAGEAAFAAHVRTGRPRDAARAAMDLAVSLFLRGEHALGGGWIARAERLLADLPEGPEHGELRYLVDVEGGLGGTDLDAVVAAARDVQELGRRHGDANLVAAGIVGEGRARLRMGDIPRGSALLDEAMVAVVSDELDPEWTGNLYCHLMAACHEIADVRRAREWTDATSRWIESLPAAAVFTGICRVHRSQVLQASGDWPRAEQEAAQVLADLDGVHVASVAEASYQLGELRRLRGDTAGAEAAYARARELGRDPQPGSALLQLAAGRTDAAAAAIAATIASLGDDRLGRARLAGGQVEIALAAGDVEGAERACAELEAAARNYRTSGLEAAALQWRGAVALARGDGRAALSSLRAACRRRRDLGLRYDAARCCALLGDAYDALGDHDAAAAERDTARRTFEELGAAPDLHALARRTAARGLPGGLTAREVEVLALVADGRTNREVAERLVLSEKTIARHLSNIFTKLGVSTRTEAAAFAFRHGLANPGRRG